VSRPTLVSAPVGQRARDRLKLTATPIHPFDLAHGVDTSGLVPAANLVTGHPNDEHVTAYYGVAPSILRTLIEQWRESPPPQPVYDYSFLDFGAGKGRAMLVASELPFREVIGIELNPELAAVAQRNLDLWIAAHVEDPTASRLAPTRVCSRMRLRSSCLRGRAWRSCSIRSKRRFCVHFCGGLRRSLRHRSSIILAHHLRWIFFM
jgi:SAM-dependent methyltransferase